MPDDDEVTDWELMNRLDAVASLAAQRIRMLGRRISKIATLHARNADDSGLCKTCLDDWPCDTWLVADGSYKE